MRWVIKKLDSLVGTAVAAVAGLAAAQVVAFVHAYLQRLGGHLDEARRGQGALLNGQAAVIQDENLRGQVTALTQARIDALESAYRAIDQAGAFAQPFVFFHHVDTDIAQATMRTFVPALPLDMPSLVFGFTGIVLGWIIWEAVKVPFTLLRRRAKPAPAPRRERIEPSAPQRQRPGQHETRRRADA